MGNERKELGKAGRIDGEKCPLVGLFIGSKGAKQRLMGPVFRDRLPKMPTLFGGEKA
jgi:hypothetical protein